MDYSNILIPIDGSEDAKYACKIAADLTKAIPGKETLHLLYCTTTIPTIIGGEQREEIQRDTQNKAEEAFTTAKSLLAATGNNFKTHIRYGDIGPTIAETAKELGCTMIIMGTRGMSDLSSIILGSVSHYVLQNATVPVLLINKRLAATQNDK